MILVEHDISRTKLVWLFWIKRITALFDAMRPLPSLLLLCGSYGGTAIEYGFSTGQHGLDYCIAEADTNQRHDSVDHHGSSNVCAAMDKPCTLYASHHLCARHVRAQPHSSQKI